MTPFGRLLRGDDPLGSPATLTTQQPGDPYNPDHPLPYCESPVPFRSLANFTDYVRYGTLSVMATGGFLTMEEAAHALGVSPRHARRLADSGAISKVARGLVEQVSVDRYLVAQRRGRTRAWAEHTAWGAVATLAGHDADWLGGTQASRLRQTLRHIKDVDDLLSRLRDRAKVRSFAAHRAALPRLRALVAASNQGLLGLGDTADDRVDGYLAAADLDDVVRTLGLQADPGGFVTLRVTGFDFVTVRDLAGTSVVAAADAATSLDPRVRGVGRRALIERLDAYR